MMNLVLPFLAPVVFYVKQGMASLVIWIGIAFAYFREAYKKRKKRDSESYTQSSEDSQVDIGGSKGKERVD